MKNVDCQLKIMKRVANYSIKEVTTHKPAIRIAVLMVLGIKNDLPALILP